MAESIVNDSSFCLRRSLRVFKQLFESGRTLICNEGVICCVGARGRTRASPPSHFVESVLEDMVAIEDGLFCDIFDLLGFRTD